MYDGGVLEPECVLLLSNVKHYIEENFLDGIDEGGFQEWMKRSSSWRSRKKEIHKEMSEWEGENKEFKERMHGPLQQIYWSKRWREIGHLHNELQDHADHDEDYVFTI